MVLNGAVRVDFIEMMMWKQKGKTWKEKLEP